MKKYILISLLFHLSFFIFLKNYQHLGNENYNKVVPITFVATNSSPNPGSQIVAPQEPKKKEEKKSEPKKEEKKIEKKIEKKEIKSKVADKKEKKVEEKIQEKTEEINSEQDKNKEEDVKDTNEDGNAKGTDKNTGSNLFGSNFVNDGDGGYIALSSEGIKYEILNEVEPEYPSQAEMIGYSERVVVSVKFLVGLKGEVTNIEITRSHEKLGFDNEVKKAIKKWRFKPIFHHGKNIKVYFEKDFIFNPR